MLPYNSLIATRYGHMVVHSHDMYVAQSLILYGEFSPGEMALYRFLLDPGDVVVEVGANLGALTLPIAQAVGDTGLVYAFEPQRLTYQALTGNMALNSVANVYTLNVAVGATDGGIHVPPVTLHALDNIGAVELDATKPPNTQLVTLDGYNLPRLDVLKIDVEGMELDVLRGGVKTLQRCRPVVVAEIDREEKKPAVLAFLRAQGYRLYAHSPPLFEERNWRGVTENAWPGVVSFNVVAHPTEAQPWADFMLRDLALERIEEPAAAAPEAEAA